MDLYFLLLDKIMPQNYKNITRNTTKRTKKAPKQANSYFLKVRLLNFRISGSSVNKFMLSSACKITIFECFLEYS